MGVPPSKIIKKYFFHCCIYIIINFSASNDKEADLINSFNHFEDTVGYLVHTKIIETFLIKFCTIKLSIIISPNKMSFKRERKIYSVMMKNCKEECTLRMLCQILFP